MNILLLGKNGQIGWELQRSLSPLGRVIALGRQDADLEQADALRGRIRDHHPQIIINAAGYTLVDRAETEIEVAYRINANAVRVIAEEAGRLGAWLIHFSTDYVFDGKKAGPYLETDPAHPLNIYGESKLAGENAIRNTGCQHLIFRSSWIYSLRRSNFPLAILQRALRQEHLEVISDSIGAPTSAHLIADVTALAVFQIAAGSLKREDSGIFNLTATGETSWYEFARFIVSRAREFGLPIKVLSEAIFPTRRESYGAPARRPENSRLDVRKVSQKFGLTLPDWKIHAARFMEEISRPSQFQEFLSKAEGENSIPRGRLFA